MHARPATAPRSTPSASALQRTILAATLVAAVLRLFRLGHQSLWIDEQFTLAAAGLPGAFAWRELLADVHGPLHTLAVAIAASLGGESEWVLRLPGALAGIALVPAMAWLADRWSGRETVAPAVWLAAGAPFLVWYAQECRNYSFLMLASVLATASLLELQRRCAAGGVLRYVAAAAGALLSNLSFATLAPLHVRLWLAPGPTRGARLVSLGAVAGALALVASPWLPAILGTWDWSRLVPARSVPAEEWSLRGETTYHPAAWAFAAHALTMGYSGGPSLRELRAGPAAAVRSHVPELAAAALVFGLLGAFGLAALRRRGRLADTLLGLVAPALVVGYFAANNFKTFHPRYLSASMPFALLVLAAAFADLGPRARRVWGLAVALLWAGSLARATFEPRYGREDYRGAMALVREQYRPGEVVIALGAPEPVEWYGRGMDVKRFWLGYVNSRPRWFDALGDSTRGSRGVWCVLSRAEDLDPGRRFEAWQDASIHGDGSRGAWSFQGVRVWHYGMQSDTAVTAPPPSRF